MNILVRIISVHAEIFHNLITDDWVRLINVSVRKSPVLYIASLLPSQPKPVYINFINPGLRGASKSRMPCSMTQHTGAHRVRTHDLEFMNPELYC